MADNFQMHNQIVSHADDFPLLGNYNTFWGFWLYNINILQLFAIQSAIFCGQEQFI